MNDDVRDRTFRVRGVDLRRLSLPLTAPLVTGRCTYRQRSLLLLRLRLEIDGWIGFGWGEAAPLPGWNDADLDELEEIAFDLGQARPSCTLTELLSTESGVATHSALRFAIECAALDALARFEGVSLAALLARRRASEAAARVAVQCTLGDCDVEEAVQALRRARGAGFTHAKLKIGARDAGADLERVSAIAAARTGLTLRLDANGAMNTIDALTLLDALSTQPVEWIEQPVPDAGLDELLARYDGTGPAIAIDESASDRQRVGALLGTGRVGAVVVKPAALGGLDRAASLFAQARRAGAAVMISNLMESAVGRSAVAHLAAAWPELPGPHGLATGAWFARDLGPRPDRIEGGFLALHAGPGLGFDPVRV